METGTERMNRSALSTSANIQRGNIEIIYEAAILKLISILLGL